MTLPKIALLLAVCFGAGAAGAGASGLREAPPGGTLLPAAAGLAAAGWHDDALAGVDLDVMALALRATTCAVERGDLAAAPATLTVIDYSKPSTSERLWVFDLATRALLHHELVAHGQGSGGNMATHFSNTADSHQSSLGLFVTGETYVGQNGYSLRMQGLDAGFNDHAYERAIVIHGAPYVDAAVAARQGRLGRSWGCPALRAPIARTVIDRIKGGGAVFAYSPDRAWLQASKFLSGRCQPTART